MKPHIKVIQRNGVDIFVTSSMEMKGKSVAPIKKVKPRRRCRDGDEIFSIKYQPYFLPLPPMRWANPLWYA